MLLKTLKPQHNFVKNRTSLVASVGGNYINKNTNIEQSRYAYYAEKYYREVPLVFGAINTASNWIASDKFMFFSRSGNDINVQMVEEWAERIGFNSKLRNLENTKLVFANAFVEVDVPKQDFYILDSDNIYVEYTDKGVITKFIQRINGKEVKIPAYKVIYLKSNSLGSELLGMSPIVPLINTIKYMRAAEQYTNEYFERNATPRLWYKVLRDKTSGNMKEIANLIDSLSPHSDIVMDDSIEIEPIGSPMQDMQFQKFLEYTRDTVIIAMGIPPIILGLPEGSNKANSSVQMQSWRLKVRAEQMELEHFVNNQLFPKIFGTNDVYMKFVSKSPEEQVQRATTLRYLSMSIGQLVKNGVLTPEEGKQMLKQEMMML